MIQTAYVYLVFGTGLRETETSLYVGFCHTDVNCAAAWG